MELTVKLKAFEGPLDLLLHLLEKNKVSIYDIPIVEITNQYLDYIREMQRQDLNVMSEFMVMAATLISIKSKMLLPKEVKEDGQEEDPREELVQQLLEYKMYKCIANELKGLEPVDVDELVSGLTLKKLNDIFLSVMRRQEDKIDKVRAGFGKIEKEDVSLPEKMAYLEQYALEHGKFSFRSILASGCGKMEVVVSFLAILELMKLGKVTIMQERLFDDIEIASTAAAA